MEHECVTSVEHVQFLWQTIQRDFLPNLTFCGVGRELSVGSQALFLVAATWAKYF